MTYLDEDTKIIPGRDDEIDMIRRRICVDAEDNSPIRKECVE
jgi:hypothetical protein